MAQVGFSVSGHITIEKLQAEIDSSFSIGRFHRLLKEAAEIAYWEAYRLCPVDTGWMKGQLKLEGGGDFYSLQCLCDYASYNEFGWRGIPSVPDPPKTMHYKGGYRPFLRPGVMKGEAYFVREVEKRIRTGKYWGR